MLIKQLETLDVKFSEKEKTKLEKLTDEQGKVAR